MNKLIFTMLMACLAVLCPSLLLSQSNTDCVGGVRLSALYAGNPSLFVGCGNVTAKARRVDLAPDKIYEWYEAITTDGFPSGQPLARPFFPNTTVQTPEWEDASTKTVNIFTFIPPAPSLTNINKTLYVFEKNGTCYSEPKAVSLVVLPVPTVSPTISGPNITPFIDIVVAFRVEDCGSVAVTATKTGTDTELEWRTGSTSISGSIIETGTSHTFDASTDVWIFEKKLGSYTDPSTNVTTSLYCYGPPVHVSAIVQPLPTVSVSASSNSVGCSATNVTLTATSSATLFQWYKDGSPISDASLATYTAIEAGSYTVQVTSDKGCVATSTPSVISPNSGSGLTLATSQLNNFCYGTSSGSIYVTKVSGGVAPYQYSFNGSPFSTNPSLPNISAGSYSVVTKDANGCTGSKTVVITESNKIDFTTVSTPTCNNTGTVTLSNISGGAGSAYQFFITNLPFTHPFYNKWVSNTVFSNLPPATYFVKVRDKNNCAVQPPVSVVVGSVQGITAAISGNENVCYGSTTALTTSAIGGTAPFTYKWILANGGSATSSTIQAGVGNFHVTIKDASGCTAQASKAITGTSCPSSCQAVFNPSKCYTLKNKKSGKTLDVYEAYRGNNIRVIQFDFNGNGNQDWRITPVGTSGFVKLTAQHSRKDIGVNSPKIGAQVFQVSSDNTNASRKWTIECVGNDGFYRIKNENGKFLDVQGGSLEIEANIVVNNLATNNDSQLWRIVETTCSYDNDLNSAAIFNLEAQADYQRNRLAFVTNQGEQGDYFTVEKMTADKAVFEKLELFNNTQADNSLQYYTLYDNSPIVGENIYRVKMTLYDGSFKYSDIKKVNFGKIEDVGIFPNPVDNETWIDLKNFEGRTVTLVISDLTGKPLQTETVEKAGTAPHLMDLHKLSAGMYLLKVQASGKRVMMKKLQVMR